MGFYVALLIRPTTIESPTGLNLNQGFRRFWGLRPDFHYGAHVILDLLQTTKGAIMALVVVDVEEQAMCDDRQAVLDAASTLHLYQNDLTPDPGTVLAELTEATYSGYASVNLAGKWDNSAKSEDGSWFTKMTDPEVFEHNGGAVNNTIYGCYVVSGGVLRLIERFASPIAMNPASLLFSLQLTYTFKDESLVT